MTASPECICGCGRQRAPDSPRFCAICRAAFKRSYEHSCWENNRKNAFKNYTRAQLAEYLDSECQRFAEKSRAARAKPKRTEPSAQAHKLRAGRATDAIDRIAKAMGARWKQDHDEAVLAAFRRVSLEQMAAARHHHNTGGLTESPEDRAKAKELADQAEACVSLALEVAAPHLGHEQVDWRPAQAIGEDFYAV